MSNSATNNGYTVSNADRYAPTTWGNTDSNADQPFDFQTPSGQTCLIRRLGIEDIFAMGLLNKLDFFSQAIEKDDSAKPKHSENNENESLTKAIMSNSGQMMETINSIVVAGVVQPPVYALPENPSLKKSGLLYVDKIPFNDRVAIFSEVLDVEGLSTFREEPENGVGDLSTEQSISLPT